VVRRKEIGAQVVPEHDIVLGIHEDGALLNPAVVDVIQPILDIDFHDIPAGHQRSPIIATILPKDAALSRFHLS
jgi:hypothetical protein